MRNILFVILALYVIQSCDKSMENSSIVDKNNEVLNQKEFITSYDTLKIGAEFDEHGEFGGHAEQLNIFYVGDKLYLKFSRTNIPDKSDYGKPNFNRKIVEVKTYLLNKNDENVIVNYLTKLLKGSLNYKLLSNAGKGYYAEMDNLYLYYHHDKEYNWVEYSKLIAHFSNKKESNIPSFID